MQNPFLIFEQWFKDAKSNTEIKDATAFCLATCGSDMQPSARIVLLKSFDETGFVFFTNKKSNKGCEILQNPNVCACFYWDELGKQIRIFGTVSDCNSEESDSYFDMRPRGSQIGAIVSKQSQVLEKYEILTHEYETFSGEIKRPSHWGGFRITPHKIEFWQDMPHRLHKRDVFTNISDIWMHEMLYP